jgi:outer membrane protein assembly factor BamB
MLTRIRSVLFALSILLGLGATAHAQEGKDWPLVRGDGVGSGVAKGTLPDAPELLWTYRVPKGAFATTPVVAGELAFVGDLDGTFFALEVATGKERWKDKRETSYSASAAYRDGRVFVADANGHIRCYEATTGKVLWTYETESGAEINSSPNFYGDAVLVGSQDATLYAVDAKSGKLRWKHTVEDQIRCSPTVVGKRTFLAGCDSKFHIVDVEAGKGVSTVEIRDQTGAVPAVLGDRVYFGTEGGAFFCIDWKQSREVWTYRDESQSQGIRSSAAVTEKGVVFGGRDKRVHCLDPKTGDDKWHFATRGRVDGSPVIVGERVFVGSADGRVYGIDLNTGKQTWKYEAGGSFSAGAAVADGRLLIANEDGAVFCFGKK